MTNSKALGVAYTDQAIVGGSIDATPIGATTPSTVAATTISATGAITATGGLAVNGPDNSAAPGAAITAATYAVQSTDGSLIFNGAAANVAVTLLAASAANKGNWLYMVNQSGTYTVISASSNVLPIAGGSAGTAILAATAGKWAQLQSTGSAWQIMASN